MGLYKRNINISAVNNWPSPVDDCQYKGIERLFAFSCKYFSAIELSLAIPESENRRFERKARRREFRFIVSLYRFALSFRFIVSDSERTYTFRCASWCLPQKCLEIFPY